ncbi:MAG: hypothetical protein N3B14_05585 [Thermoleophilia bacterium]|nr:hypothetical protein [Thermoleophilia bacterium]
MKIAVGVFFVLFGVGLAYVLFRLGGVFKRVSSLLADANTQVIPLLTRLGETLDGVKAELDRVEQVTGSVAEIAKVAEESVTAVKSAISRPVRRVAGLAAGISEGLATFFSTRRKEN